MADSKKAEYSKSTAQLDLERRLADDSTPVFREFTNPDPVSEDGFVGVDPIYQNAANDTEVPLASKGGAEKKVEQLFVDAYGDGSGPSDQLKENYAAATTGAQSTGAAGDSTDTTSTDTTSTDTTSTK